MSNFASEDARHWLLDPEILYLNHGSFGACPRPVLEKQRRLRDLLEREPVTFLDGEGEKRLDEARETLAEIIGAEPCDLVFVSNATAGVNTVLRSLTFNPGDQIIVTNHGYNACSNAVRFAARQAGAQVVVVDLPFPLVDPEEAERAVLSKVTNKTRLSLIDHITSPTALVLPIARIVRQLQEKGVETLVDGAHAAGQVPLRLNELGASYYTGNCHKWLCTPKGSAFLHVRRDRQEGLHPLSISHGYNVHDEQRPPLWLEFDWTGTDDPTAFFCIPKAIDFLSSLVDGGLNGLMERNHRLALAARNRLCEALNIKPPCPDSMVGAMAAFPLPPREPGLKTSYRLPDPLHDLLLHKHCIEVPIMDWPAPPRRLLRISAQAYNSMKQYEFLAEVLRRELF